MTQQAEIRISPLEVPQLFEDTLSLQVLREPAINMDTGQIKEFERSLGRRAALQALKNIGLAEKAEILRGPSGEPIFPAGYCGSIAHCRTSSGEILAGAIAARKSSSAAVGLDIENRERFDAMRTAGKLQPVIARIACNAEIEWTMSLPEEQQGLATGLLWCAKEASFKLFFPLCFKQFGFKAVELIWVSGPQLFKAVLKQELSSVLKPLTEYLVNVHAAESGILYAWCRWPTQN